MQLTPEKKKRLDRLAKLKPFAPKGPAGPPSDAALRRSIASLGQALQGSGEAASIHLRLVAGHRELARTVVVSSGRAEVLSDSPARPSLEVALSKDDWWAIARGETSPAAVFLMGRMRVRGDCELARRLCRHLASSTGSVEALA
jgi:putative sterol carrier protein